MDEDQDQSEGPSAAGSMDLPVVDLAEQPRGGPSRRTFLAGAAGLTGVALANGAWRAPALAASSSAGGGSAPSRATAGSGLSIDLTLDGIDGHSFPSSFETFLEADVVAEAGEDGSASRKRPGKVKFGDITLKAGTGMSKHFYNWVKDSFDGNSSPRSGSVAYGRKSGSIIACDFRDALLSEVGFPALDAVSKDAAKMTVKFSPTVSDFRRGSSMAAPSNAKEQKKWLASNFRLSIGDLPCGRVNKIDAITVKQAVVADPGTGERIDTKEPAKLEFPNLAITFPEVEIEPWDKWFEDFIIKGNNGSDKELVGSLTYLATDGSPLFLLDFTGVGIFKLAPEKAEAGAEGIRRVKAEMYCERIKFTHTMKF